jgi:hypothetical protein
MNIKLYIWQNIKRFNEKLLLDLKIMIDNEIERRTNNDKNNILKKQ